MATNFKELKFSESEDKVVGEVWEAESKLCLLILNNASKLFNRLNLVKEKLIRVTSPQRSNLGAVHIGLSLRPTYGSKLDSVYLDVEADRAILEIELSQYFFNISNKVYFSVLERASVLKIVFTCLNEILEIPEEEFLEKFGG